MSVPRRPLSLSHAATADQPTAASAQVRVWVVEPHSFKPAFRHSSLLFHHTLQDTSAQFLRPHLLKMAPYTPILPFEILSQQYGRKPEDIIKLDANEVRV